MGYMWITEGGDLKQYSQVPTLDLLSSRFGTGLESTPCALAGITGFTATGESNPVGACVLAAMGGGVTLLRGPLAIAGHDPQLGVRNLPPWAQTAARDIHLAVRCVIDGLESGHGPAWDDRIRQIAQDVVMQGLLEGERL